MTITLHEFLCNNEPKTWEELKQSHSIHVEKFFEPSNISAKRMDKKLLLMYYSLYQNHHKKSVTQINQEFFNLFLIQRNWIKNFDSQKHLNEMKECIDFLFDLIKIENRSLLLESLLMRCSRHPHLIDTLFMIKLIQWDDCTFIQHACMNLKDECFRMQRSMFISFLCTRNGTKFNDSCFIIDRYQLIQRSPSHSVDALELIAETFPQFFSKFSFEFN